MTKPVDKHEEMLLPACKGHLNKEKLAIIKKCLKRKINVDVQDAEYGYTCMHYACRQNTSDHIKLRNLLLKHGAKVDIPSTNTHVTAADLYDCFINGGFTPITPDQGRCPWTPV